VSAAGDAWVQAVTALGGDRGAALAGASDLDHRYAEKHRRHHTVLHVNTVVRDVLDLASTLELDADDRRVLMLAACAHDVVYDVKPGDDEDASAAWARGHLTAAGVDAKIADRVETLVLSTKDHCVVAGDRAMAVLHDADMAVLGAPPEVYDRYALNIREEFVLVPDEVWRFGRTHVLQSLMSSEPLFVTAIGRDRWETQARANMNRELAGFS
jgi:predicted metal-dependent HD superfamily phosphohydrolase